MGHGFEFGVMHLQPEWYTWYGWNARIFLWVNHMSQAPALAETAALLSSVAQPRNFPLWIALLVIVHRFKPGWISFAVLWSFVIGELAIWAAIATIKPDMDYPRPLTALGKKAVDVIGKPEYWHSFPSGHSALAFLLFGSLFFGTSPKAIWVSALIYALLVAWSRIAVGAHFPTDVIGGAFIGLVGAGLAMLMYRRTTCGRTTG